jgi:hypothetical protein
LLLHVASDSLYDALNFHLVQTKIWFSKTHLITLAKFNILIALLSRLQIFGLSCRVLLLRQDGPFLGHNLPDLLPPTFSTTIRNLICFNTLRKLTIILTTNPDITRGPQLPINSNTTTTGYQILPLDTVLSYPYPLPPPQPVLVNAVFGLPSKPWPLRSLPQKPRLLGWPHSYWGRQCWQPCNAVSTDVSEYILHLFNDRLRQEGR